MLNKRQKRRRKYTKGTLAFAKAGRPTFWRVAWPGIPPIEASSIPPAPWKPFYTPHSLAQKCLTNDKKEGESTQKKRWSLPRPDGAPFGASPGPASRPLRQAVHLQPHWKPRAIPHSLAQKCLTNERTEEKAYKGNVGVCQGQTVHLLARCLARHLAHRRFPSIHIRFHFLSPFCGAALSKGNAVSLVPAPKRASASSSSVSSVLLSISLPKTAALQTHTHLCGYATRMWIPPIRH